MKLLALDTSSDACSVALQCDEALFERHVVQPKVHTLALIPMIEAVLADAGIGIRDLDAIVAGIGPGSFIGVRIAVSVAQGLAFAGDRKVVPVSSLAAVAAESFGVSGAPRIVVAQDAHMNEVYLARFENGSDGLPLPVDDPVLHGISGIDWLEGEGAGRWLAAGAGWRRYPELLACNEAQLAGVLDVHVPRARFLLGTAGKAWRSGAALEPERLVPAYVRQQVASVPVPQR